MWKQWRIEGGKEKGEDIAVNEEETTLPKVDEKTKSKGKYHLKDKDGKGKKKETHDCNHCGKKGHIEVNWWKKETRKQKRLEQRWKKNTFCHSSMCMTAMA